MLLRKIMKKSRQAIIRSRTKKHDKPLPAPTEEESQRVTYLRERFKGLFIPEPSDAPPSEKEWLANVNRLKELVLLEDPREFLRWDVILKTMSVTHAGYTTPELKYLQTLPTWDSRWRQAIEESQVGHPIPHWQYPKSSGNLIHHGYHVAQFEEKTGLSVDGMDFILEFGGGYGSMCRLIHQLGFRGRYVIFDLPAFSALQEFYLGSLNLRFHTLDLFDVGNPGVLCISDPDVLTSILSESQENSNPLFIATWSLSETPIDLRSFILPLISSFKAFLIAYQDQFNEINNIEFFARWRASIQEVQWEDWKLEHLPNHNRYLVGVKEGMSQEGEIASVP